MRLALLVLALVTTTALAIEPADRRPLVVTGDDGEWLGRGVCYSAFRDGQGPGGAQPTREQILEDLRLLDPHFDVIRTYSSGRAERWACEHIREQGLGLKMVLGAWISPEHQLGENREPGAERPTEIAFNDEQVALATSIANDFPDVVIALVVGNETQIFWSDHAVNEHTLARRVRQVRDAVAQPVSTADVFNWWNTPESMTVADECDFVGLHAYAMWNGQQLTDAMSWTREQIDSVRARHPGMPIFVNELGWATSMITDGDEGKYIKGAPGEREQELFYRSWRSWAEGQRLPYTWFEAFDERWKNPAHVDAVENNWGLWRSDRTPKLAIGSGPAGLTAD